ncbi:hypothetical protein TREES_T100008919 [Tupaia chinensis]|uniref:Uncharacterized protein n=1 Tax=Tupaia chinensis TaxID=246437 RepID=L9KZI9_TUPCH|nr:hypothetical protein TREES_T100008919 [Tupaia chinensis]
MDVKCDAGMCRVKKPTTHHGLHAKANQKAPRTVKEMLAAAGIAMNGAQLPQVLGGAPLVNPYLSDLECGMNQTGLLFQAKFSAHTKVPCTGSLANEEERRYGILTGIYHVG